jgi:L-2-hydroxyglutarate oxidase
LTRTEPAAKCDVAVIGGGIVGLATARELLLRDPKLKLSLFEREPELATHQTGHTSGVIHVGIYYEPGSLKARLCVEGARELYAYCEQHGIEARRDGKLIVAANAAGLLRLDELERRAAANGVRGLRRLAAGEIAEVEPHARGVAALHSLETGVVDFRAVATAFAGDVRDAGGAIFTHCGVKALIPRGKRLELVHDLGLTRARFAVSCAGAWSDKLAVDAGAPGDPRIVPFRGSYKRLRPERAGLVRASIYPVPDPELPFLGAHLTRTFDGTVLLGPSALMVGGAAWPGAWRLAWRHRRAAARELRHALSQRAFAAEAARLVPGLTAEDFLPGPSGVRAQAMNRDGTLVDDFVVHETEHALHLRNAPSPAATSALPLARLIADRAEALM